MFHVMCQIKISSQLFCLKSKLQWQMIIKNHRSMASVYVCCKVLPQKTRLYDNHMRGRNQSVVFCGQCTRPWPPHPNQSVLVQLWAYRFRITIESALSSSFDVYISFPYIQILFSKYFLLDGTFNTPKKQYICNNNIFRVLITSPSVWANYTCKNKWNENIFIKQ